MTTKDQEYQNNLTDLSDFLSQHVNDLTARLEALEAKQSPVESEPDKNTYQLAPDSSLAVFLASESEPVVDTPWPQKGDYYWSLNSVGGAVRDEWLNDATDIARTARGNVSRTREEAVEADLLDVAMNELKVMSEKAWVRYHAQVTESHPMKYFSVYDPESLQWSYSTAHMTVIPGVIYFPSADTALAAIRDIGPIHEEILR